MGETYFQESDLRIWVKHIFRFLTYEYGVKKYFQEFGQTYMPILWQEYILFFCLPLSIQPRLNTQQQGHARGGGPWNAETDCVLTNENGSKL